MAIMPDRACTMQDSLLECTGGAESSRVRGGVRDRLAGFCCGDNERAAPRRKSVTARPLIALHIENGVVGQFVLSFCLCVGILHLSS